MQELNHGNFVSFLAGGGEMGARVREFDWSASPIGAPDTLAASTANGDQDFV